MWMPEEFGAVTQAYGRILGQPCPDWMTAAAPVIRYVPPQIRQTGGPAIQGGAEIQRRMAADLLERIERG